MKRHPFIDAVKSMSFDNCFNPYTDRCLVHDKLDAPRRRAMALSNMIEMACHTQVDAIWIGRDLGYRGGRRTGLALTDDVHVHQHAARWGISLERTTTGDAVAERTAAVIWDILDRIDDRIFLWNVFPLHPHEADNPFSNRMHNAKERAAGQEILKMLVSIVRPRRLVAIGNDATRAAERIAEDTIPVIRVRHPSYGGQSQFLDQITELHGLSRRQPSLF